MVGIPRLSSLAERIAWARSVANLPGKELEALAGIGETNVHYIEQQGRVPNGNMLSRIARVLNVSVDWLLDGTGEEPTIDGIAVSVARARQRARPTGTDGS